MKATLGVVVVLALLGGVAKDSAAENEPGRLQVLVNLPGPVVTVGAQGERPPCGYDPDGFGCVYTLPAGRVALSIDPSFQSSLIKWSDEACGREVSCEILVTPAADEGSRNTVTALFGPLTLDLNIAGRGTVKVTDVASGSTRAFECDPAPQDPEPPYPSCGFPVTYSTLTEVELEPVPKVPGDEVKWGPDHWCDAVPGTDHCRTQVSWGDHFVAVAFGDAEPFGLGFGLGVSVRIDLQGDGGGTITVRNDRVQQTAQCNADCSVNGRWAERLVLDAEADGQSSFRGWGGEVCTLNPRCEFSAGAVTFIRPTFARRSQPPPPPPPRPPTTPPPTTLPPRGRLDARLLSVAARREGKSRWVVARLVANQSTTTRARLMRGPRRLVDRSLRLRSGRSTIRLALAPAVRAGRAQLVLELRTDAGSSKILRALVRIPPRK